MLRPCHQALESLRLDQVELSLLNLIRKLKSPQLTFSFVFSRYSYFHKLLPLLLTGLSDDIQEIQKKSSDLFDKVLSSSNFGQWPTLGPVKYIDPVLGLDQNELNSDLFA